jgi:cation diffusion facilitator CzcD-associated flavoprotein CzcO
MHMAERLARRHLEGQVPDPELRAKLLPSYSMGCKRVLLSDDYFPALVQPNVDVVTSPISEVRPHSIVTGDGVEHEVDTIIFGTGFHVTDIKIAERIADGEGVTLAQRWRGSPQAYQGTTVAGYPNLFLLVGPNTGLGHNSIVFMIESQVNYIIDCLRYMRRHQVDVVEPLREIEDAYNAEIQRRMEGTVWTSGGCASWYLDATGKNTTLWPGFTWPYRRRLRTFDPDAYTLTARSSDRAVA